MVSVCFMALINLLECMSGVCVFHGVFNIPRQYAMLVSCYVGIMHWALITL